MGRTPLMWSITEFAETAIPQLILNGADINATDIDLNTPLHLAVAMENEETVRLLIKKGEK